MANKRVIATKEDMRADIKITIEDTLVPDSVMTLGIKDGEMYVNEACSDTLIRALNVIASALLGSARNPLDALTYVRILKGLSDTARTMVIGLYEFDGVNDEIGGFIMRYLDGELGAAELGL